MIFFLLGIALYFMGLIFLLRGTLSGIVFSVLLLGNAANMLLFILSGPRTDSLPFVTEVAGAAPIQTDPLPHALILTAIVIGFAMVCFVSSLVKQVGMATGSDDFRSLIQESE